MKTITSKENPTYRRYLRLLRKKYRDRYGEFIVEGKKLVDEAVSLGRAECILASKKGASENGKEILSCYEGEIFLFTDALFESLADTEHSQGIAAVVKKEDTAPDFSGDESCLVVLDRLQDPGNIGTIIRTAEAAGYSGVVAVKGTADIYSPKVVRAAAGSILRVPIVKTESEEETAEYLAGIGKTMVCTAADAKTAYYDVELEKGIALVIGNEGRGVSKKMQDLCPIRVRIPMKGHTESLNAAVAAGILMYQKINSKEG